MRVKQLRQTWLTDILADRVVVLRARTFLVCHRKADDEEKDSGERCLDKDVQWLLPRENKLLADLVCTCHLLRYKERNLEIWILNDAGLLR